MSVRSQCPPCEKGLLLPLHGAKSKPARQKWHTVETAAVVVALLLLWTVHQLGVQMAMTVQHALPDNQTSRYSMASATAGSAPPLRIAIYNQVDFHLHVVAGAMRVLQPLTSAPVTVFLTNKVLKQNWYGFMDWLGKEEGFEWRDWAEYDAATDTFDLVWFISPEFDLAHITQVAEQMKPALQLFYVHNGHMPDQDFEQIKALSPDLPILTMAPHVATYVSQRLQQQAASNSSAAAGGDAVAPAAAAAASAAEWVLPIWPFQPAVQQQQPCRQGNQTGNACLQGFSVTGSLDKSLRNYSKVWEQMAAFRDHKGPGALQNFKLNILGDVVHDFAVPEDLQQYVELYKTPPDPVFYDVIYHSYGLVPALANPAYYTCKLTSAAITTLMTGVPIIADDAFLAAYSMLSADTVYHQLSNEDELDVMFRVVQEPTDKIWRKRAAVEQLREKMNWRSVQLLLGWLAGEGLKPDAASKVVQAGGSSDLADDMVEAEAAIL